VPGSELRPRTGWSIGEAHYAGGPVRLPVQGEPSPRVWYLYWRCVDHGRGGGAARCRLAVRLPVQGPLPSTTPRRSTQRWSARCECALSWIKHVTSWPSGLLYGQVTQHVWIRVSSTRVVCSCRGRSRHAGLRLRVGDARIGDDPAGCAFHWVLRREKSEPHSLGPAWTSPCVTQPAGSGSDDEREHRCVLTRRERQLSSTA
jgi:hypothetical protein